jgi:hypothetical protein
VEGPRCSVFVGVVNLVEGMHYTKIQMCHTTGGIGVWRMNVGCMRRRKFIFCVLNRVVSVN